MRKETLRSYVCKLADDPDLSRLDDTDEKGDSLGETLAYGAKKLWSGISGGAK